MNARQLRDLIMQHEELVANHCILLEDAMANNKTFTGGACGEALARRLVSRERLIAAFDRCIDK